ncbi:hypothetical protein [Halobacillus litoralis]|uniref:hypothetical protein n=1 Tax=Halobacillus litoralis TaxID=45668 RepID=UPI001CD7EC64|nr:hypothetical protein [Halobacillus litoralis]MCA1021514.1 hypothetical protein [Halobacillus litoralis]
MLIVVIGVDGVGKSTLIKYMQKKTGYRVLKGSSFEQSDTSNDQLYSNFFNLGLENNVILDRYFQCNLTYAPLYGDYAMINDEQVANLEELIRHKAKIIYLYASSKFIKDRIDDRGDNYVKSERVPEILKGYAKVMRESTLPITKVNVEGKTTEEIFKEAFSY